VALYGGAGRKEGREAYVRIIYAGKEKIAVKTFITGAAGG
jgi:hypothetical protein